MPSPLLPLIDQLLHSENITSRINLSKNIIAFLDFPFEDFGAPELKIRRRFIVLLKVCSVNPGARQRESMIAIANFYEKNYTEKTEVCCL